MDVRYVFRGLLFEWDEAKARMNLKKHGVSFETSCEVFLDPLLVLKNAGDPDRKTQVVIWETMDERLLFVVHVVRNGEVIRIISARPVTKPERREYEG